MSETKLKTVFKVKQEGQKEVEYAVLRPNPRVMAEAKKVYNRKFRELVEAGTIIRSGLDRVLKDQKVWDEGKNQEAEKLRAEIIQKEKTLCRGLTPDNKKMKISEGRALALEISKLRGELGVLYSVRNSADANTAEAQADNEHFNYLVSQCLVYNDTGEKVFKDLDDYLENGTQEHGREGANHLSVMLGGGDANAWKTLPENAFLLKYNLMDDKGRLINKDGKLVDQDGRLINEEGYYINGKGQRVDRDGCLLDKDGNYLFEDASPYIDDDTGRPISEVVEPIKPVKPVEPGPGTQPIPFPAPQD